jgi:hypothetical protein
VAWASVIQVAVTVDTIGIRGGASATSASRAAMIGTTGSIIGEWNACDVCSRRTTTSAAASWASSAAISSVGPDATHSPGAFSAAISTPVGSRGRSSSAGSRTDSMLPAGSACIWRPRSTTSASASGSVITSASAAHTNSPTEWPTSAVGVTPQLIHSRASEYSSVKIAGWVTLVATSVCGSSDQNVARGSWPSSGVRISQQASYAARNAGSAWYRPRPICAYCDPWPGHRKPSAGNSAPTSRPPHRAASGAVNSRAASAVDSATT